MSVARQLFLLQLVVLVLVIGAGTALASRRSASRQRRDHPRPVEARRDHARAVGRHRRAPCVPPDPTAVLQPQTERIRRRDRHRFHRRDGARRHSLHPHQPGADRRVFTGNIERALAGETFTETYAGSLGPSIRAVAPVYDSGGTRIRVWCPSASRASRSATSSPRACRPSCSSPASGLRVGGRLVPARAGACAVRRWGWRRTNCGTMYEHHDAVLHSHR